MSRGRRPHNMSHAQLSVLGPLVLRASAESAPVRLGRKSQSLLACIAGHGPSGVTRSQLLAFLWPEQAEDDARAALRQCLLQLRRALPAAGDWIVSCGEALMLDPASCDVDLWRFEAAAQSGNPAQLLAAARLWRGEFGLGLGLGSGDAAWFLLRRQQSRDRAHAVLQGLAALPHEAQRFGVAQALARQLLAEDPLHEGAYRALMRLYVAAGLGGKALETFEECRQLLKAELGVSPSPLTQQAAAEVSQAPAAPVAAAGPAVDHMVAGWHYFSHFTPGANARARTEYQSALRHAPALPEAIAMLGWTHWVDSVNGWSADAARSDREAAGCAARAVELAPDHPASLSLRSKVRLWQHQHDAALDDMRRALALAPDMAYMHYHLADVLAWSGHPRDALAHVQRALALNPNDHGVFLALEGFTRFLLRDLAAARDVLERARIRNPSYAWTYSSLGSVLHELGEHEQARQMASQARALNPRLSVDFTLRVLPFRLREERERLAAACEANGMPAYAPQMEAAA